MEHKKKPMGRAVTPEQQYIRDTIVKYIEENGKGTTPEFIKATEQPDNDVRRALRFLKKNHIIYSPGKQFTGGVGNPPMVWELVK